MHKQLASLPAQVIAVIQLLLIPAPMWSHITAAHSINCSEYTNTTTGNLAYSYNKKISMLAHIPAPDISADVQAIFYVYRGCF